MKKFTLFFLICITALTYVFAQSQPIVSVFEGGQEGYESFRIPALVTTNSGVLLAFCEARVIGHDHAENDIALKRSADNGKTWEPLRIIKEDGKNSLNDPNVVVLESGRILLIYQRFPQGVHARNSQHTVIADEGYDGPTNTRTYISYSDDDGITWSESEDITRSVRRSNAISIGSPGRAIQLNSKEHRGRIVIPFYQVTRLPEDQRESDNYVAYSDDNGVTWERGGIVPDHITGSGNETQIVELQDGRLLMNSRNQWGEKYRKSSISTDGGESWAVFKLETTLMDAICMGSMINYNVDSNNIILFSNAYNQTKRANGTIHISDDEGKTWSRHQEVVEGPFMYSCMSVLEDGTIGLLYESKANKEISFIALSKDWILGK